MRETLAQLIAVASFVLIVAVAVGFAWQQQGRRGQIGVDPASWAALYPQHYASFVRTAENYGRTAHGGSEPYDKLAANPFRRRAWAGLAFELEYNAARGHHYAQIDQRESRRTLEREQPAGCIHCHAAEAPRLVADIGWDALHAMAYDEVQAELNFGSSCTDCHAPDTMALRITRPALQNALRAQGIDPDALSREDLRSYVCAQCHVEYYFRGSRQELVFPWAQGRRIEDIEQYYDETGHSDWTHEETGAAMIKMQHPETELYGAGLHASLGLSCADCHMPSVEEQGLRISDHWIRSPLTQLEAACMNCHRRDSAESLSVRVAGLQDDISMRLATAETAIGALMDAIVAARAAGADDAALVQARWAHRRAQLRWDFIDAENSTGFHAAREARRILDDAAAVALAGVMELNGSVQF